MSNVKRVLDLSQPIYPNNPTNPLLPPVELTVTANHVTDGYQMERLVTHTHDGTHMDATWHMWDDGQPLHELPVEGFVGPGAVFDMGHKQAREAITADDLAAAGTNVADGSIALLVTGWTAKMGYTKEWVFEAPWLRKDGADWLIEHGIVGVGIDHISVAGMEEKQDYATHQALARGGKWVLENLVFPAAILEPVQWLVVALPLPLRDTGGAPARAIAMELA
jgi:kynurenine formamidase